MPHAPSFIDLSVQPFRNNIVRVSFASVQKQRPSFVQMSFSLLGGSPRLQHALCSPLVRFSAGTQGERLELLPSIKKQSDGPAALPK